MGLQRFLSSRAGKRFYNIAYCWGACLVILGAVFKIAHMPYDNIFLMIGLFTEVFIFFISGFDVPASDYKWENVFPQLKPGEDKNAISEMGLPDPDGVLAGRYVEQMQRLEENIKKLNSAYESQIKNFEGCSHVINTEVFSDLEAETVKLTAQVKQLNSQYGRMLEAFNVKDAEKAKK